MMMDSWSGMGPGLGWVFLLLMIAGIAALVVLTVRLALGGLGRGGHHRPPDPQGGRARAILDERYARGEIDHAEYDERVARLRDAP